MVMKITPEDLSALREYNDYINEIIKKAADRAAETAVRRMASLGKVRYVNASSYQKTEQLLYLYPRLAADHPDKLKVAEALEAIENDEYRDVIVERYFEKHTIAEIAEIYGAKYQTISKQRTKLVRILAGEIFPEEVADEIMGRTPGAVRSPENDG